MGTEISVGCFQSPFVADMHSGSSPISESLRVLEHPQKQLILGSVTCILYPIKQVLQVLRDVPGALPALILVPVHIFQREAVIQIDSWSFRDTGRETCKHTQGAQTANPCDFAQLVQCLSLSHVMLLRTTRVSLSGAQAVPELNLGPHSCNTCTMALGALSLTTDAHSQVQGAMPFPLTLCQAL